jgi:hypothetical protein
MVDKTGAVLPKEDGMTKAREIVVFVAVAAILFGCTALGWRFGPGFSCRGKGLFAAPPVVERSADGYVLTWTYGDGAFFFQPGYRAIDGRLVFSLQGSSSSGDVRGRHGEVRIDGVENIAALEAGGAVWWEPDGSYVALETVEPRPR